MRQFVKLNDIKDEFEKFGVNVVGMTYDTPEQIEKFHKKWELKYSLLKDVNGQHVDAWDIRNTEYGEGTFANGIPHPGVALLSPKGEILAKFAEPGYRGRPDWSAVLAEVGSIVGGG